MDTGTLKIVGYPIHWRMEVFPSHPITIQLPQLKSFGSMFSIKRLFFYIVLILIAHQLIYLTMLLMIFSNRVLQANEGIEYGLELIQWELAGTLFLGWVIVYLIVWRGLHQSGYIIWFTALFPYFVMITLLVRALTLEGAVTGLQAYINVRCFSLLHLLHLMIYRLVFLQLHVQNQSKPKSLRSLLFLHTVIRSLECRNHFMKRCIKLAIRPLHVYAKRIIRYI